MNAWPYITAAYALTIGGTVVLSVAAYLAMRRAEAAADTIKRQ